MNRVIFGAALAVALFGSVAYAAGPSTSPSPMGTPSTPTTAPAAPAAMEDNSAECKALGTQWETAEAANASNSKLGKAKAKAMKAEKNCVSTKASKQKTGISQYKAALKLLGVTPAT